MDDGTIGNGDGDGTGNGTGGNGLQPGKGCSFAGDRDGELPLGSLCLGLLIAFRLAARRRARRV